MGRRFGRIRSAQAATMPAASALRRVEPSTAQNAIAQAAATGTSDMGWTRENRTMGLVATSKDAATPAHGDRNRHPRPYVARTRSPPDNGAIQKIAHAPPSALPAAMSSGKPGGYDGTMVPRSWPGT